MYEAFYHLQAKPFQLSADPRFVYSSKGHRRAMAYLVYGAHQADSNGMVAAGWLALAYLLHTTGELCLSPVGLSMVTKLSVPRVVGLMMGVWFLSSAFSHYVAGLIAAGASVNETPGVTVGGAESLSVYVSTFGFLAWVAVGVGAVVLALSPLVRRFMHETEEGERR